MDFGAIIILVYQNVIKATNKNIIAKVTEDLCSWSFGLNSSRDLASLQEGKKVVQSSMSSGRARVSETRELMNAKV